MEKYQLMELSLFTNEKLNDILVKELEFKGPLPDPKAKNFRMQMVEMICDRQDNKGLGIFAFADLLAACKQNGYVNSDFNKENFPLEPVASDESEWEVYEHHFDETVNGMDAFKKLEELGYRLCGPRRAMEYVANGHLDVQLDHSLIVTARWQNSSGVWCAPIFRRHYDERRLSLCGIGGGFDPSYGWLVLRKRS